MQNRNKKILLFDLGGVIINLNTQLTINAFAELANRSREDIMTAWRKEEVFKKYEKGEVSDNDFREFLRMWLRRPELTDADIDATWNTMILDLPKERLEFLLELREEFQVMLLSNTNDIHMRCVNERVKASTGEHSLDPYFDYCYYSQQMKLRKPEPAIFRKVIELHSVHPGEVLFLDDTIENIKGAESVGINTMLIEKPEMIFNVRKHVK